MAINRRKWIKRAAIGSILGGVNNVFISRGVGTVGLPCRANCRPEIVLLTLTGRTVA